MKIEGSKYRLINYFDVWGNEEVQEHSGDK